MKLLIKNAHLVLPTQVAQKEILIEGDIIQAIETKIDPTLYSNTKDTEIFDAKGLHVFPGFIDTQVHFREPGLTHKEDLATGSLSALHGGVTCYFEMPNTNPPTLTASELEHKVQLAKKKSHTNFGFFLGTDGNNIEEIKKAHLLPGCCGVKIFLGSSTGPLLLDDPEKILKVLESTSLPISIHSEDEGMLRERFSIVQKSQTVLDHPVWRSTQCALSSTKKIVALAKQAKRKVHILHISSKEEIDFLVQNAAYATFELTPQHMILEAPACYEKLGTFAQMNPPIRDHEHRQALRKAFKERQVSVIGSDHAPHTKEEKSKNYPASPSGMPGVQTVVPLCFKLAQELDMTLVDIKNYLCTNPAQLFSIPKRGDLIPGNKADLTLMDLNSSYKIKNEDMKYRCGWTPFHDLNVMAGVKHVLISGTWALKNQQACPDFKGQAFNLTT